MATTTRQTNLFVSENWQKVYQTFKDADFQSYDFETLRTTMITYLRRNFPEDFNDFVESSEYIALVDLIAFFGQSLAYRQDLNARENFLETAQRRDSILRLANMLGYKPKRNTTAQGMLKVTSMSTTEPVLDSNNNNLSERTVYWNDPINADYEEQFNTILNAALANSQKVGKPGLEKTIGTVKTQQYELALIPGTQPYLPFQADINRGTLTFELVNGTMSGQDYIYEKAPVPGNSFNMFYRTDGQGNSSANTGFFTYFKQGELGELDFQLNSGLPNITYDINVDNINNSDVWLFSVNDDGSIAEEWTQVPAVNSTNVVYNSLNQTNRKLYAVDSRANDQIKIVFGDGVFADIPKGRFKLYYRQSAGASYSIKSGDLQNVELSFNYISRSNQQETLTVGLSLQQGINTASSRESLARIKQLAPQNYYTQNRMVNGEDYNIYPLTKFTSIIKSKAINRTSSGISRFLDVKDSTGKYSSTNIFADDGVIYRESVLKNDTFTFTNDNDIISVIKNVVEKNISNKSMYHFYLNKFVAKDFPQIIKWNQINSTVNTCTGYFTDANGEVVQVEQTNNTKYLSMGGLIRMNAPSGFHFMKNGTMMSGDDTSHPGASNHTWCSITQIKSNGLGDGTGNGRNINGDGAITLNEVLPTGALVGKVHPKWVSDLTPAFENLILAEVREYKDFGLRYDYENSTWHIITNLNLARNKDYSNSFAGATTETNSDASWLLQFTTNGETYTIKSRQLDMYFSSKEETRFYFDETVKIYDSVTGDTIRDNIRVLGVNNKPGEKTALENDYRFDIVGMNTEIDGYKDNTKVKVTFSDSDLDSITDNPESFDKVVGVDSASDSPGTRKLVFFESFLDYDNIERYKPMGADAVVFSYGTTNEVEAVKSMHPVGTVFYCPTDDKFVASQQGDNSIILTPAYSPGAYVHELKKSFKVYIGRDNIKFQYKHNAPNNKRIDPSPSNIVDLYLLTQAYSNAYTEWLVDTTESLTKPDEPTSESLRTSFMSMESDKAISDSIIYHSAKFKPLFGAKADTSLQATFKVVKNTDVGVSDSEVKSKLVEAINVYFNINNWDFGDTFYFSELGAWLHNEMSTLINSVIIVPKSSEQTFGSLFQIKSNFDEILVSGATVDDVEIIDSITASKIQASGIVNNGSTASSQTGVSVTATSTTSSSSSSSSGSGGSGY